MSLKLNIAERIRDILLEKVTPKIHHVEISKIDPVNHPSTRTPLVQFYGVNKLYQHQQGFSRSVWTANIRVILREKDNFTQTDLWIIQESIAQAMFSRPDLGMLNVSRIEFVDEIEDKLKDAYISDLGINIHFKEQLR